MTPRHRTRLPHPVRRLLHNEAAPGVLLMLAAAASLVLANSVWASAYHDLFHHPLGWTPIVKLATPHLWINDGLMALFFFVVGLEIKREVRGGALEDAQRRRMPVAAALAGMLAPAAVFLLLTAGEPGLARGWAIPAATDIAFALGVLALAGKGLPSSLRLFLLAVAIVDDLGAVIIIALFYTAKIYPLWLVASAIVLAGMALMAQRRVGSPWPFALAAVVLWYCVLHSGLHATIAGVAAALTVPYLPDRRHHDSLLLRMEHALVPWNGFLVVPLFGFANAGVALAGGAGALAHPLALGIAAGLLVGKFFGVVGVLWLCQRTEFAQLPRGATWPQLMGVAALCGIGFTMSLFIGALAFPGDEALYDRAKIGILAGSGLATIVGFVLLRFSRRADTGSDM